MKNGLPLAGTVLVNINPPDLPSINNITHERRLQIISVIQKELEETNKGEQSPLNVAALGEIYSNGSEYKFYSYVMQQVRQLRLQKQVAAADIVITPLLDVKKELPAKRVFRVLTCSGEEGIRSYVKIVVQGHLGDAYDVNVADVNTEPGILEFVQRQPIDLIVPLVNNVITGGHGEGRILKAVELLARLKQQHGMPIIALSAYKPEGFDLPGLLKRGGIDAFFWSPFDIREFRSALNCCLPHKETCENPSAVVSPIKPEFDPQTKSQWRRLNDPSFLKSEQEALNHLFPEGVPQPNQPPPPRLLENLAQVRASQFQKKVQQPPALVKPVFTVLTCDDPVSRVAEVIIKSCWEQKYTLRFISFSSATELLKLTREQSFDLIFFHVSVLRDAGAGAVEVLGQIKAQYGKPIIATQGVDRRKLFEGTGVTFIQSPFSAEEFRDVLKVIFPEGIANTSQRKQPLPMPHQVPSAEAKNEQNHLIASAIGEIAASLPMFDFAPGQTVKGVGSLWKMSKGMPLDKAQKSAAFALAIQHAAAAKVKDYAIDNATNRPPLPPKLEARLTDIAQRQLADPTRLPPEDWITLACLTDNQSSDFHPDANAFYLKAKEVARQLNTAAGSAGVTPTLQEIGIRTLQALILANPRLDFLKTADTLGIPLPKDAADATVATQARNDEQENQPRKLAAPVQIQKKSFFQKNLNELERNILEKTFSILKFLFSLFTIIIIWIFIAYIFRGCNFIHPD